MQARTFLGAMLSRPITALASLWYAHAVALPEFTVHGLLPLGVHDATLDEVLSRFGGSNARRKMIGDGLKAFVELVQTFGLFTLLFVDGSFTTDVDLPNDVDVVLQLPSSSGRQFLSHPNALKILDAAQAKATYHVHLFLEKTEDGYAGMVGFFQQLKPKDLLAKKLAATHRRGIVKVRL
jgi:hypothetical protein